MLVRSPTGRRHLMFGPVNATALTLNVGSPEHGANGSNVGGRHLEHVLELEPRFGQQISALRRPRIVRPWTGLSFSTGSSPTERRCGTASRPVQPQVGMREEATAVLRSPTSMMRSATRTRYVWPLTSFFPPKAGTSRRSTCSPSL
jgi:hypothetical protein